MRVAKMMLVKRGVQLLALLLVMQGHVVGARVKKEKALAVNIEVQHHAAINVMIGVVGKKDKNLSELASIVKRDFEFSGQCNVAIKTFPQQLSKKHITKLFKDGYPLAVFISNGQNERVLDWRLYDTYQACMIKGKQYKKRGKQCAGWAHNLADAVWPTLTGQNGFFSTKIAYCKQVSCPGRTRTKHIFVADYDGNNEQLLVSTPTINVAPRWNKDKYNPLLFYSEGTNSNIRLMVVDMKKRRKVVSDFDGLNMLPAFSKDGKKVVYCASHGEGSCQLYYYKKGKLKQLTHNNGNNVSPTLSDDGNIVYFCSDFQTGRPQLYSYDIKRNKQTRLTQSGYCAAPSYCSKRNAIAYSKMVKGKMQLFLCDVATQEHTQLTTDRGNKQECSWSPCGNYLLFSVGQGGKSAIATLNLLTNERRTITSKKDKCSYPTWSPEYIYLPTVA